MGSPMQQIFCERQRGGLCRLHALNNFLGDAVYNESDFTDMCNEYDREYPHQPSCADVDTVQGTQEPVFAYILRTRHGMPGYMCCSDHLNKGGLVYALGKIALSDIIEQATHNRVFVYDEGHVWTIHKLNGVYYTVDSIRGVVPTQLSEYIQKPNLYYYFVINKYAATRECQLISKRIKLEVGCTSESIIQRLIQMHDKHQLICSIEALLCHLFTFLYTISPHEYCGIYREFRVFYDRFQRHPGDFDNILKYVPYLITSVA
jgi:hypothetical protein